MGLSSIERHITLIEQCTGQTRRSLEEFRMRQLTSINKIELCSWEEKLGHIFQDEIPIAKKLRAHIKIKIIMSSKSFKKLDKLANIHNLVLKKTIRKMKKNI